MAIKAVTVEDYRINVRVGRAYRTGTDIYKGKTRKLYKHRELYKTDAGEFEKEEWTNIIREIIELSGQNKLLEQIKEHCRENCVWLKKESDIEEYAMNCLASRAYRYWKEFEYTEEPVHIIFIFNL